MDRIVGRDSDVPSLVWKIQLAAGLRESLNASIGAALAEVRRELPPLEAGCGWQSGQALHRRDERRELVSCVERGVTSILRVMLFSFREQLSQPLWSGERSF